MNAIYTDSWYSLFRLTKTKCVQCAHINRIIFRLFCVQSEITKHVWFTFVTVISINVTYWFWSISQKRLVFLQKIRRYWFRHTHTHHIDLISCNFSISMRNKNLFHSYIHFILSIHRRYNDKKKCMYSTFVLLIPSQFVFV